VLDGLVVGGVVASLWGLAGIGLHSAGFESDVWTAVAAEGVLRAKGPYGSPNNLALFLGRLVPVIAGAVVWGGAGRRRWYAVAALPIGLAFVATFSRAAVVVGMPVIATYLVWTASVWRRRVQSPTEATRTASPWTSSGRRWRWPVLGAVAVAVVLVLALAVPLANTRRVRDTFSLAPGSTLYIRTRLWTSAIEMGRDHPWLGVGLDNFLYHYRDRYMKRDVIQDGSLNHPHNWLLDWWTRLGVPGLAIFAALALGNLWLGAWLVRRGPPDSGLAVAALGMQVYALAHGLVDNSFFLVDLAAVWWIGQAALLGSGRSPVNSQSASVDDGSVAGAERTAAGPALARDRPPTSS